MGNLHSIKHKLEKINIKAIISNSPDDIKSADFFVMPGVGHFAKGMENLRNAGLDKLLTKKVVVNKTPVIGICLGMQLFSKFSEEGNVSGLGWIDAETKHINLNNNIYKIPHIGWNLLIPQKNSILLNKITSQQKFYFVHSYHVDCMNSKDILATTKYGKLEFISAIHRDNIFGCQFHPEKSHRRGMDIIKNFTDYCKNQKYIS